MIEDLSTKLLDLGKKAILKQRQDVFLDFMALGRDALVVINTSLVTSYDLRVHPKANLSVLDTSLPEFLGNVLYYLQSDQRLKALNYIYKHPKEYHTVANYAFSQQLLRLLTMRFIYDTLPVVYTRSQVYHQLLQIPEREPSVTASEVCRHSSTKASFPCRVLSIHSSLRRSGKLYYYFKIGTVVDTDIRSKQLRKYVSKLLLGKNSYGVVIMAGYERVRQTYRVQLVSHSTDPALLKRYYTSSLLPDDDLSVVKFTSNNLLLPSSKVTIHRGSLVRYFSLEELVTNHSRVRDRNICYTGKGFHFLSVREEISTHKVTDFALDTEGEPLGVLIGDLQLPAEVTADMVLQFQSGLYVRVRRTYLDDVEVSVGLVKVLSSNYKECGLCGSITTTKPSGLCWRCNSKVFRWAVVNGDKDSFTVPANPVVKGLTFSTYKYKVRFEDEEVRFNVGEGEWKGKQLYLPYDWWA